MGTAEELSRPARVDGPDAAGAAVDAPAAGEAAAPMGAAGEAGTDGPGADAVAADSAGARNRGDASPVITVSALIVPDGRGRVLTVRKRGTSMFMLPGGKPEAGETPAETAVREFAEELGVRLDPGAVEPLGEYWTPAANEAGHRLHSFVFRSAVAVPDVTASAEIAEARWVRPDALDATDAPLTHALRDLLG